MRGFSASFTFSFWELSSEDSQFLRKYDHFRKILIRIKMMPFGSEENSQAPTHNPAQS